MKAYRNYPVKEVETLKQLYQNSRAAYGNRSFLIEKEGESYHPHTFKQFGNDVEAVGTQLLAMGLCGKKIVLLGENSYAWSVLYMAIACGVGVVIPYNRECSAESLADIIERTGAEAIFASAKCASVAKASKCDLPVLPFSELPQLIASGAERLKAGDRSYLDIELDPEEMRVLVFTTSSIGVSKGVMLSHKNICFNLSEMCRMIYIDEKDRFLSILPLHHVYECTCGFLCPLYCGASVTFGGGLHTLLEDMQAVQPTIMLSVPLLVETVYRKLWDAIRRQGLEEDVKINQRWIRTLPNQKSRTLAKRYLFEKIHLAFGGKLRIWLTGGAPANPEALKGLRDFGIFAYQTYSLSECAPLAAINRDTFYRDASAGMAFPNALLDVYDMQDDGVGEIRYKADNVMLGYYNMPERTEKAIRNGWLYTGDMGMLDENGFLYIVGRKRNVILTPNGKNVFPEELEGHLVENAYIKEAAVLGAPIPDSRGCRVVAIIHPDYDRIEETYGRNYTKSQVDLELRRAIAVVNSTVHPYKHIESYIISRNELPRHSSRKIDRIQIQALLK